MNGKTQLLLEWRDLRVPQGHAHFLHKRFLLILGAALGLPSLVVVVVAVVAFGVYDVLSPPARGLAKPFYRRGR